MQGIDPLTLEPVEVFKEDRKSRVWRVQLPDGESAVVKLFTDAPLKQWLWALVGRHPAQREVRWHRRLAEEGVPTVVILAQGQDASGRRWLVTPYAGLSLYNWLRTCDPWSSADRAKRSDLSRQLGQLVARLLAIHVNVRDFKASNLLVGDDGKLRLIDAGSAYGARGTPALARALSMLTKVHANLIDASTYHRDLAAVRPSAADRMRVYRAMLEAFAPDHPPDGLQHLPGQSVFEK